MVEHPLSCSRIVSIETVRREAICGDTDGMLRWYRATAPLVKSKGVVFLFSLRKEMVFMDSGISNISLITRDDNPGGTELWKNLLKKN